ncbi:MAG TPA: hypothetical protein VI636_09330 [Candidatus Angelobacter sp.]
MAAKVNRTLTVTKRDGSSYTHVAEFVRYETVANGVVAVEAVCCGSALETSRHTLPFDVASKTEAEILGEINDHLDRVAKAHAAHEWAHDFLESLAPTAPPQPSPPQPVPLTSNSSL